MATLPGRLRFQNTPVGGLSGISYDRGSGSYLVISDDPSERSPARVYRMNVALQDGRLEDSGLHITGLITLRRADGTAYPRDTIDPEGIAVARDGTFYVSSEGNARIGIAPFVRHFAVDGRMLGEMPIPQRFLPGRGRATGIRQNKGFEALTLTPDGKRLIVGTESALRQDGPADSLSESSPARLLVFDTGGARELGEYVYTVARVSNAPTSPKGLKVKGLSELLALDDSHLLALERAFVEGHGNSVQLEQIDLASADDVSRVDSLRDIAPGPRRPVGKRTLLDFSTLPAPIDNFEGMTLGPALPHGRRLLLVISDNNFNWITQLTEVLAFAAKIRSSSR
ncbi:MAG: esterase-like activity of phytase family protein [Arenicellales bacterium]